MNAPQPVRLHGCAALFDGGFPYAATVAPGATLFTAGISPLDAGGAVVAPGDLAAQVVRCLTSLDALLAERGTSLAGIAKLTVYLATSDRADLAAAWRLVTEHCGEHVPPAVIVAVTVLPYPGQLAEIDAVVAL